MFDMAKHPFPKDFLWGASTAAHQVEGHTLNQWSVWEKQMADELACSADKRFGWLPDYAKFKSLATDPKNYISGAAIEHYERYEADFDLAKQLHLNAFRFSIEWSRVEPQPGEWDEQAITHYRRYIAALKKRHLEPIPTLWHWTMPVWFTDRGGFQKRRNLVFFERFVAKMIEEFGSEFRYVLILNEPNVYAAFSYLQGNWPPQHHSLLETVAVFMNLKRAHCRAYKLIKELQPAIQVGCAAQLSYIQLSKPGLLPSIYAWQYAYLWNWWFLNRTRYCLDFIGLNYYFTDYFSNSWRPINPQTPINDMGWYLNPGGLYPLLGEVYKRYHKPLIITENGVPDRGDKVRKWWLEESLAAMQKALQDGLPLFGYLYWSLLDNFEWDSGWWPKFGLIEVNRQTMERTIRPSGRWFGRQVAIYRRRQ